MAVILAGCGGGNPAELTGQAIEAIKNSKLVMGSGRLLKDLDVYIKSETVNCLLPDELSDMIEKRLKIDPEAKVTVLFSGDTGIYSGAEKVGKRLENAGIDYEIIPGLSSFALMAAAMKVSYKDTHFLSAHGREVDIIQELMLGWPLLVLTDAKESPNELCKCILRAGIKGLKACVGENLTYVNQKLTYGTVEEISRMKFDPLSVLYLESLQLYEKKIPGIPDEEFIRGDVPMTRQNIRAAIMAGLRPGKSDVCWDIGSGTGSVAIELALLCKRVYAVEKKKEAIELIEKNRQKFAAFNINVVEGDAAECIHELETPQKVFIGGSGGRLDEIVCAVLEKNEKADLMITAVTIETLNMAVSVLEKYERDPDITQISVSRTEKRGGYRMFKAENPVFIISG